MSPPSSSPSPATSAPPPLRREHVLGMRSDLRHSVHLLSEDAVLYPASNAVVLLRTESKDQRFIELTRGYDDISAVAVSPDRRLIAVAERGQGRAEVNVYDSRTLRRKKALRLGGGASADVSHMSFGADSKSCLVLGSSDSKSDAHDEYVLSLWTIDTAGAAKVVASTKLTSPCGKTIYRADMSPFRSSSGMENIVCVTGESVLRFFRLTDGAFRPVSVSDAGREPRNCAAHAWLSCGRVAIGTECGDLLYVHDFEVGTVPPSPDQFCGPICSVAEFTKGVSKGLVLGRAGGIIQLYNRIEHDDQRVFSLSRQFSIRGDASAVMSLAVSPRGDGLVCSTADTNMYSLPLSSSDILDDEEGSRFEFVLPPFHRPGEGGGTSEISCADVCLWKSVVATGGVDRTVRVWNYHDKVVELTSRFDSEVLDVSLHPSGLSVVVCAADAVRHCAILSDRLDTTWQRRKRSCGPCRFAHGGHYFALVNHAVVQVYDSYTFEVICSLRGHSESILSVQWGMCDMEICTIGADGVICVWAIPTGKKLARHADPLSTYTCGAIAEDFSSVYVSTESAVHRVNLGDEDSEPSVLLDKPMKWMLLPLSGKVLFGTTVSEGGCDGSIETFSTGAADKRHTVTKAHLEAITCSALTADRRLLFTASRDGTLSMFRTNCDQMRADSEIVEVHKTDWFSEERLVSEADLDRKSEEIESLRSQMRDLQRSGEERISAMEAGHRESLQSLRQEHASKLALYESAKSDAVGRNRDIRATFERDAGAVRAKHEKDISDLQRQHQLDFDNAIHRLEKLMKEREDGNNKWNDEQQSLVNQQMNELKELTNTYHEKTIKETRLHMKLARQKEDMISEHKEWSKLVENDADEEMVEIAQKCEEKLSAERMASLRLKEENIIVQKKYDGRVKDLEEQKDTILSIKEKETHMLEKIKGLEDIINKHQHCLREKDRIISEREREILTYEETNREMHSCKFSLGNKIKSLKEELKPKETEIATLQKQIVQMDLDLEGHCNHNGSLKVLIRKLQGKLEGLKLETAKQERNLAGKAAFAKKLERDLRGLACNAERDYHTLKRSLFPLFKKYLKGSDVIKALGETSQTKDDSSDVEAELRRRVQYLEKSIETVEIMTKEKTRMIAADVSRLQREKKVLVSNLKELVKESEFIEKQQDEARRQLLQLGLPPPSDTEEVVIPKGDPSIEIHQEGKKNESD